jgi:hypothetical protein
MRRNEPTGPGVKTACLWGPVGWHRPGSETNFHSNPKVSGSNPAPATNVAHAASWFTARRLSCFMRPRISKA